MIYDNDNNHMQVALPVVSYCETWTYSIAHKVNAFEMWCYRECRELVETSHTTNIDVLQKMGVKETT